MKRTTETFVTEPLAVASGFASLSQQFNPVATAPGSDVTLSPVLRALVLMLILVPSTEVLGYFRNVRFADENRFVSMPASQNEERKPDEFKVLAEGFHSTIQHPFVAVVRDPETYSELTKLDGSLPKLDEEFFKSNIVVAAFLGERNTGGYAVEISREADDKIRVSEKKPGKGMFVPQVITSPFRIVSLERGQQKPATLVLDDTWRQRMQSYFATGKFTESGGFAGRTEEFPIAGQVRIIREAGLVSFAFELVSVDERRPRQLTEFATAVVEGDHRATIHKMSADLLVRAPNNGLKASVTFANSDKKFSTVFMSLPTYIADGYSGMGSIEAEAAPSSPKQ